MADPMYRQIADDLRRRIESGELGPGSQLPTELELRERYHNASRQTVRDAVRLLVHRGLVVTRPGQGTFVAERIVPFAITMSTDSDTGSGASRSAAR
jgi:GntR family transcriptional regulator